MGDPQNSEFVTRTNHTACIPCVYYYYTITIIVFFFYFVIVS